MCFLEYVLCSVSMVCFCCALPFSLFNVYMFCDFFCICYSCFASDYCCVRLTSIRFEFCNILYHISVVCPFYVFLSCLCFLSCFVDKQCILCLGNSMFLLCLICWFVF